MSKIIKVSSYVTADRIIDIQSSDKNGAIKELLGVITKSAMIGNSKEFEKEILKREELMSTGIGYEIAIPHARANSVHDFVIAIGRSFEGIEYSSIDDKPVKVIFMIGASLNQDKDYIKLLSRLVLRLKNEDLKTKILLAKNSEEILTIIHETK